MTEIQRIQADSLADLFEEHGIVATREQIEAISKDFSDGLDMARECSSYAAAYVPTPCNKCASKDYEIKQLESDIKAYKAGVKHRHPNAQHVYVKDGNVYYDL